MSLSLQHILSNFTIFIDLAVAFQGPIFYSEALRNSSQGTICSPSSRGFDTPSGLCKLYMLVVHRHTWRQNAHEL